MDSFGDILSKYVSSHQLIVAILTKAAIGQHADDDPRRDGGGGRRQAAGDLDGGGGAQRGK